MINTAQLQNQTIDTKVNSLSDYFRALPKSIADVFNAYSGRVESMYKAFEQSEFGRGFIEYLENRGYKYRTIDDYLLLDSQQLKPNAIAAIIETPNNGKRRLAVNKKYLPMLKNREALLYVMAHEYAHAVGIKDEAVVDQLLHQYIKNYNNAKQRKGKPSIAAGLREMISRVARQYAGKQYA